ncbi:major tail protein [Clostridium estertheticum]|uniref:Phage tail protein n=1 Tax=Clostridium estertheticum TaxID=238834 RepID=A0AA47I6A7_9CLOT|nr:major tail protein [Clostridium estertheticum]MBU3153897.1 phage tail protein [Clostridium estertheticum]WAG61327.1 phage tail protein [Clostridium estertheticum]
MSRLIGLKDITIAQLLTDTSVGATYEVPKKLERSIKATLKPKTTQTKLYSDDTIEEVVNAFDSIDVEIEVNQLSIESRAMLQGSKVVKGVLIETKNDIAPTVAMAFKAKKSNGKYMYVWLYKGSFEITEDTFESSEDKLKDQTAKLKATFYAREFDGAYRLIADEDAKDFEATTATTWFTTVAVQPTEV